MDLEIIENNLEMIESVVSCKIVKGDNEDIEEVHIVSNNDRGAKQIARDVQSVLIATYNIPIDHKKISIAQIKDGSLKKAECRLKLLGISMDTVGSRTSIKVSLGHLDSIFENTIAGMNTRRNLDRMLVDVTLKTVEEACDCNDTFSFEDMKIISISNYKTVMVMVMCLVDGREQRLCGSCIINNDYEAAVVRAVLDAINRFITR